eukprot:4533785-Amphidinium_carterae.2
MSTVDASSEDLLATHLPQLLQETVDVWFGDTNSPFEAQDRWTGSNPRGLVVEAAIDQSTLHLAPPEKPTRVAGSQLSAPDLCCVRGRWIHTCETLQLPLATSDHSPLVHAFPVQGKTARNKQKRRLK